MIRLPRLFENHLADPEVSGEELYNFGEDMAGRVRGRSDDADHGPAYTAILATLTAPLAAFEKALGDRATLLASLGGQTITKDDAVRLIRTTLRKREGRVRDRLGEGSAGYHEFYPQGLREYNRARLGQFPPLLERLVAAADKYKTQLGGSELLAEFQHLKETFSTARTGQVDQKGELADARRAVADTRAVLEAALGIALLDLAKLHFGHPERAVDFFNQSLLEDPTRSQEPPAGNPPVNPPAGLA